MLLLPTIARLSLTSTQKLTSRSRYTLLTPTSHLLKSSTTTTLFRTFSNEPYNEYEYPLRNESPLITTSNSTSTSSLSKSYNKPNPISLDPNVKNVLKSHTKDDILQPPAMSQTFTAKMNNLKILTTEPVGTPQLLKSSDIKAFETEVTTLPNGLRVSSQETFGQLSTFGLIINCGSRYDNDSSTQGLSNLIELMCFKGSDKKSASQLISDVEFMGASVTSNSSREELLLCIDTMRDNTEKGLTLLANTISSPVVEEGEVDYCKQIMELQQDNVLPQMSARELIHTAAYGKDSQVGNSHLCLPGNREKEYISEGGVEQYRQKMFTADRMVLCGAGVNHGDFVELAKKLFGDLKASPTPISYSESGVMVDPLKSPTLYIGGEERLTLQEPPIDGLTRITVAFPCPDWHSSDLVPLCVLQLLLGGGDSFSAGGPGKGMYSRLYREVLNRYYWIEGCESFTSIHSDCGLFGITGACESERAGDLQMVMLENIARIGVEDVEIEELERAKNMLKCNVLTQLESRAILFEDIGRQILTYNKRETPSSICKKIENVSVEDIRRVGVNMLKSRPSISAVGYDLSKVVGYEKLIGGGR